MAQLTRSSSNLRNRPLSPPPCCYSAPPCLESGPPGAASVSHVSFSTPVLAECPTPGGFDHSRKTVLASQPTAAVCAKNSDHRHAVSHAWPSEFLRCALEDPLGFDQLIQVGVNGRRFIHMMRLSEEARRRLTTLGSPSKSTAPSRAAEISPTLRRRSYDKARNEMPHNGV